LFKNIINDVNISASLNSTAPFGLECFADTANIQGVYDLPAEGSWEPCVPDPSYIPGCKSDMWPKPTGKSVIWP